MKSTTQLKKEANKILDEIRKREGKEIAKVQIPFLKSLVGAAYVYRDNSYGSGSAKWDVFRKILDYVETDNGGFHFIYEENFIDSYGKATLFVESHFAYLNKEWHKENPFSGFVQCAMTEYNAAKEKTLEEMRSQNQIRENLLRPDL